LEKGLLPEHSTTELDAENETQLNDDLEEAEPNYDTASKFSLKSLDIPMDKNATDSSYVSSTPLQLEPAVKNATATNTSRSDLTQPKK
ncbi:hypothetical protein ILYODFUR_038330, partial [Ilyodon furcidens]